MFMMLLLTLTKTSLPLAYYNDIIKHVNTIQKMQVNIKTDIILIEQGNILCVLVVILISNNLLLLEYPK